MQRGDFLMDIGLLLLIYERLIGVYLIFFIFFLLGCYEWPLDEFCL